MFLFVNIFILLEFAKQIQTKDDCARVYNVRNKTINIKMLSYMFQQEF